MTEYIKSIQYSVWNSYSGNPFYSLLFIAVFRWEFFEWPQQICSLWAIVSHPALFLMEYSMLIKVPSSCFGIVVYGLSNLVKLHTPSSIIYIFQSGWVKSLSFISKKMSALKIFGCIRTKLSFSGGCERTQCLSPNAATITTEHVSPALLAELACRDLYIKSIKNLDCQQTQS